jgi:hypothetical protein
VEKITIVDPVTTTVAMAKTDQLRPLDVHTLISVVSSPAAAFRDIGLT